MKTKTRREPRVKTLSHTKHRVGDIFVHVTTKTEPAVVSFNELLELAKLEYDECHYDCPWDDCDGYAHKAIRVDDLDFSRDQAREARGCCWHEGNRERVLIKLLPEADLHLFEWYRARGASKQVAQEIVANQRRRTLDQLTEWYEHGWSWMCAVCEYEDFHAYVGGILDPDEEYGEECRLDMVWEVVHEMEKEGYTVTDQPERRAANIRQEGKRLSMRRNLHVQDWKDK